MSSCLYFVIYVNLASQDVQVSNSDQFNGFLSSAQQVCSSVFDRLKTYIWIGDKFTNLGSEMQLCGKSVCSWCDGSLDRSFVVLHNWCNKGRGMCYPVCGMVHIKYPLLLIKKSSPYGISGFPLSLSEWFFTIMS